MIPPRRVFLSATAPALAATAGLPRAAADTPAPPPAAAAGDAILRELVERAAQAHVALMRGDVERYRSHIALDDTFTLMSPFGGKPSQGGRYTREQWESIGRFFRHGHGSTFELVEAWRSTDLVVLAAIERTRAEVGGLPAQPWTLRVTLVFRREGERWLLAHRHADPLAPGISVAEAASLARGRPAP